MDTQRPIVVMIANPIAHPISRLARATTGGPPVLSGTLPSATFGVAYSQSLGISGGQAPLVYDISVGTLPAGLTLNTSTGVISGTPTAYGDNSFTVRVTDAGSNVSTSAQSVTVYGVEQAPTHDNAWSLVLQSGAAGTVTQDNTGIIFAGANNLANGNHATVGNTVDGATYEVVYSISGLTGGSYKMILYGNTTAHAFQGTSRSANGTYTERGTTSGAGTNTNRVLLQAIGANGANSAKLTIVSIRRVG
jgi:hypothetical protein